MSVWELLFETTKLLLFFLFSFFRQTRKVTMTVLLEISTIQYLVYLMIMTMAWEKTLLWSFCFRSLYHCRGVIRMADTGVCWSKSQGFDLTVGETC